jgi:hypothetical protein
MAEAIQNEYIQGNTDHTAELNTGEWKVKFSYGTIKGISKCSAKSGDQHQWTWPINNTSDWTATTTQLDTANGMESYCWCLPTGFDQSNSGSFCPIQASSWVLYINLYINGENLCPSRCADHCALIQRHEYFRRAMYGVTH